MDMFERTLRSAKNHNSSAMMELITMFAWRLVKACREVKLYDDDDFQSYMLLRFIERVYEFKIDESVCGQKSAQRKTHERNSVT